jgi:hypothetical protein
VAKDGEIIVAGSPFSSQFTKTETDPDTEWAEPKEAKFEWTGKTKDEKAVTAVVEGPLDTRLDRVDIMDEVPAFVKNIVAAAAGTKPYIYQVSHIYSF